MDAASYATRCRNGANGRSSRSSTVVSSTARTPAISGAAPLMKSRAPTSFSKTHGRLPRAARSNEYFTSAARTSRPLWNFAPRRRWNVYVRASPDTVQRSARAGVGVSFSSSSSSASNTWWMTPADVRSVACAGSSVGGSETNTILSVPPGRTATVAPDSAATLRTQTSAAASAARVTNRARG